MKEEEVKEMKKQKLDEEQKMKHLRKAFVRKPLRHPNRLDKIMLLRLHLFMLEEKEVLYHELWGLQERLQKEYKALLN